MSASAERELVVTRTVEKGANVDTTVTFSPTPFVRGKKKEAGIKYPSFPEIGPDLLQTAIDFFGNENFFSMLNESIRLWVQGVYNSSVLPDGNFDEKTFIEFMSELSTRGETKEEIETALANLRAQMIDVMARAESATDEAEKLTALGDFVRISKEVKKYDAILASKKRVKKPAAEATEEPAA